MGERTEKEKNVQLASRQAPDRVPRRWVSKVPLAFFRDEKGPGWEKLADSDRNTTFRILAR